MRVLVLGGTGAIGKALIDILKEKNIEIYVTSRRNILSSKNIKYIQGNAHDVEFLKKLLDNNKYDAIVDFMVYEYYEFEKKVELFLSHTNQYVFISSARVYSNEDEYIKEETIRLLDSNVDENYLLKNEYALEKAKEENLLLNSSQKNWTIIRPYITYNDNRLQLGIYEKEQWLYRVLKGKKVAIPNQLLQHYTTLTYGGDVSTYISKLLFNPKALGEIFQIADNNIHTTWEDIYNIYHDVLQDNGIKFEITLMPTKYDKILPINIYQLYYDRYYDRIFNSNKLENLLDEKIEYAKVDEMLKICIEKCLKNINLSEIVLNSYFTGIMDKITKDYTSLNEFKGVKEKLKYIFARYTLFYELKKSVKNKQIKKYSK